MANKKNKIEVKGTKLQKTCLVLQIIIVVLMIICGIYANANDVNNGFINAINNYGLYVVLVLLLVPYLFKEN